MPLPQVSEVPLHVQGPQEPLPPQPNYPSACIPSPFGRRAVRQLSLAGLAAPQQQPPHSAEALRTDLQALAMPWLGFWSGEFHLLPARLRQRIRSSTHADGPIVAFHVYTDGSADRHGAGWGAVLCAQHQGNPADDLRFVGLAAGPVGPETHPFRSASNNAAEAYALAVATAFSASVHCVPCWLHSDSKLALGEAAGWNAPIQLQHDDPQAQSIHDALRHLTLSFHASGTNPQHAWIKGHAGHLWNEAADRAADLGRKKLVCSPVPATFGRVLKHPLLPWAWAAHQHADMPSLESLCSGAYEPPDNIQVQHTQAILADSQVQVNGPVQLCKLRMITANVCTATGKTHALKQQATEHAAHILALQETRLPATHCRGSWLTYHSGARAGHEGCAIWFNSSLPWIPGKPSSCASAEHFTVLHACPTCLAVSHTSPWCKALFVTFHAPHSMTPPHIREEWWDDLVRRLDKWARVWPLVLLGDANAKISQAAPPNVGTVAVGEQDWAGDRLTSACKHFGLTLLNTHESAVGHVDPTTWRSARLDYVAVPLAWGVGACLADNSNFDLLNQHDDHKALIVDIFVQGRGGDSCAPARRTFRSLTTEEYAAAAASFCAKSVPWNCDVHTHAETLLQVARKQLSTQQALRAAPCGRKEHVSQEALALLQQRKQAKRHMRSAASHCRRHALRMALRKWHRPATVCQSGFRPPKLARWQFALWGLTFDIALQNVKRQLRIDRVTRAAAVAEQIKEGSLRRDPKAIFKALRSLRPASKSVQKPWGPLPIITDQDGIPAQSVKEVQDLRARHFAAMEVADPFDARTFAAQAPQVPQPSQPFSIHEIPTLLHFEREVRALASGKAPGLSGIPSELWKASPASCARQWYPLLVKSIVRLSEPVRFSTCVLLTLFKGKGSEASIENHRAIYLFENVGKLFRRLHRSVLVEELDKQRPRCLQGSLPGSDSAQLTHYLCTFLRLSADSATSAGLLFVDTRAAFYRVVRQALATQPLGLTPHAQAVILTWFAHAGFIARGQNVIHRTQVGTRPGDTVSDILFGFVMCDALLEIRERMGQEDLLRGPIDGPLCQPAWADDLCVAVHSGHAAGLRPRLIRTCAIVHEAYLRRCMDPNYNRGKTEALCAFHGEGARQEKIQLLQDQHILRVPVSTGTPIALAVVHRYTHLGTVLDAQADPVPDLDRKGAQAVALAKPLARHVFRNEDISRACRWTLFHSVPLASASHNVGVWTPTPAAHKVWNTRLSTALRFLLPEDRHTHHPRFPGVPELCGALSAPCPAAVLLLQRLRLLVRIFRSDNRDLWELLCAHAKCSHDTWLSQVWRDLEFIHCWAPEKLPAARLQQQHANVDTLAEIVLNEGPKLVKWGAQAVARQTASLQQWTVFQSRARALHLRPPVEVAPANHACPTCQATFPSASHLAAHRLQAHGHQHLARSYSSGSICKWCLTQFWTPQRLFIHLARGQTACLPALVATTAPTHSTPTGSMTCPPQMWPALKLRGPRRQWRQEFGHELIAALSDSLPCDIAPMVDCVLKLDQELADTVAAMAGLCSNTRAPCKAVDPLPDGRKLIQAWL